MRAENLSWDDYFMSVGFLSGMRSKDPVSQVGACIVNNNKIIVSIGYNGMPKGCQDDEMPWGKESTNKLETKYMYVCHAEMNAIVNKNSANVEGCTIYVALFPCNECAKIITQSQIKEVVYFSDKHELKPETIASKKILKMAGVTIRQHRILKQDINFNKSENEINLNGLNINEDLNLNIPETQRDLSRKRSDYISWEEFFMALAFLSSLRSKDSISPVGACIVNKENKIVGIGYNGMPRGCDESQLPWDNEAQNVVDRKSMYMAHASVNAILNKNCPEVFDCSIYVSRFPCNECAKVIIQAGIKSVIFYSEENLREPSTIASKRMFDMVQVAYRKYNGKLDKISINFDAINWNSVSDAIKPL